MNAEAPSKGGWIERSVRSVLIIGSIEQFVCVVREGRDTPRGCIWGWKLRKCSKGQRVKFDTSYVSSYDSRPLSLIYMFPSTLQLRKAGNAFGPLAPFALMRIEFLVVNQSVISPNYVVLFGLNLQLRRHRIQIGKPDYRRRSSLTGPKIVSNDGQLK